MKDVISRERRLDVESREIWKAIRLLQSGVMK